MKNNFFVTGLVLWLIQFAVLQNAFAVSYPIQINSGFTINSGNQFDLNQTETVGALQSRMKTLLQHGEIFPTGLYVQAGTTLTLNISSLAGTHSAYGKVIITDRYAGGSSGAFTQTVTLVNGNNNINVTVTGNVFISYADATPNHTRKLRFTFNSGYVAMPCFIKDQTTNTEWLSMLQNYAATPDVVFIFKRGVMVLDRTKIETYKNNDFNRIIKALDDIIDVEVAGSGIIETSIQSDKNRDFSNLLYFTSNDGDRVSTSNPHATNPGLIRVPIDWIATINHIFNGGAWGISHEIGHHQQQNAWDWGVNNEVQVNIHTLMAKKLIYPEEIALDAGNWRNTAFYLTKDNIGKDYDNTNLDLKTKLPIFWQLQLAYGNNDFYKRFYKYVRENAINSGNSATEKLNFMKTANTISNKNLLNYFIQWGLNPTTSQINTLNSMGLQEPAISPLTYSEADLLENYTLLRDTIVYEGRSVNYKVAAMAINGVKKVEFYDGVVKIGESTGFPFQLTFTPNFGTHPITAKLIDGLDNVMLTTSVKNVTVNRVEITCPTKNTNYLIGDDFTIKTQVVTIPGNNIQKVEFYDNGVKIGESTVSPYQYHVVNSVRGIHQLTVKVYYQNGITSASDNVYVSVGGLFAEADTYVRDGSSADNNYGLDGNLVVKEDGSGFKRITFLKFKLSDLRQTNFAKATLKLNIDGIKTSIADKTNWELYFVSNDSWQEDLITFNNKPTAETLLATTRAVASGAVEWDITNQLNTELNGDKYISLMLKSTVLGGAYDVAFVSKENQNTLFQPILQLFTADEMPIVTNIVSPVNTNFFTPGSRVQINVITTLKLSNPVQKVEFYLNSIKIGETSTQPFQYTTANLTRGSYEVEAKAYYQDGTISDAQKVYFGVGSIAPLGDAYVRDGSFATTNYGNEPVLVIKNDVSTYNRETYLKFKLTDITTSSFAKAVVRLNIVSSNSNVTVGNTNKWEMYFVADDTWEETTIRNNNKPVKGALLATVSAVSSGAIEWDITNQLNTELAGDKNISLYIISKVINSQSGVDFASKENSNVALRPELKLYTNAELVALPVSFISFTAKATTAGVALNWKVASETNHKQYIVSRSTNGTDYTLVGTTTAYNLLDKNVGAGTYYYKLEQQDNDGKVNYLSTQVVKVGLTTNSVSAYPNPTKGSTTIAVAAGTYSQYSVVSLQGTVVANGNIAAANTEVNINLSGLSAGTYIIKLTGAGGNNATRIIKI